jgi:hypothetical protein
MSESQVCACGHSRSVHHSGKSCAQPGCECDGFTRSSLKEVPQISSPQRDSGVEKAIRAERASRYGDHHEGHTNVGKAWTAIIQQHYGIKLPHDLPAHEVALMLGCNKLLRAATPGGEHHEDNYDDARVYVQLARESAERTQGGSNS